MGGVRLQQLDSVGAGWGRRRPDKGVDGGYWTGCLPEAQLHIGTGPSLPMPANPPSPAPEPRNPHLLHPWPPYNFSSRPAGPTHRQHCHHAHCVCTNSHTTCLRPPCQCLHNNLSRVSLRAYLSSSQAMRLLHTNRPTTTNSHKHPCTPSLYPCILSLPLPPRFWPEPREQLYAIARPNREPRNSHLLITPGHTNSGAPHAHTGCAHQKDCYHTPNQQAGYVSRSDKYDHNSHTSSPAPYP